MLNCSRSTLGLRLPASCILNFTEVLFSQLCCQGSPREWEKNTVNLSLLIFSEIFFTSRILESCHLLIIPLPRDWHLTVGSRGPPSPTFLLWRTFRCQCVQDCGPVSLSGNSTQQGSPLSLKAPPLTPFIHGEDWGSAEHNAMQVQRVKCRPPFYAYCYFLILKALYLPSGTFGKYRKTGRTK